MIATVQRRTRRVSSDDLAEQGAAALLLARLATRPRVRRWLLCRHRACSLALTLRARRAGDLR